MNSKLLVRKQRWSGLWLVLFRDGRSRTPNFLHRTFESAVAYATTYAPKEPTDPTPDNEGNK